LAAENRDSDHLLNRARTGKFYRFWQEIQKLAARGLADLKKIRRLLKNPFFSAAPPKSLDRNAFGPEYLRSHFGKITARNLPDVLAALNYFTAASIALAVEKFVRLRANPVELVASGGGALNKTLMKNLSALLSPLKVVPSSSYGVGELAKEPACFALMALFALRGKPNNCPSATGAKSPRILGKITPA